MAIVMNWEQEIADLNDDELAATHEALQTVARWNFLAKEFEELRTVAELVRLEFAARRSGATEPGATTNSKRTELEGIRDDLEIYAALCEMKARRHFAEVHFDRDIYGMFGSIGAVEARCLARGITFAICALEK
jgi:hypothetical protein